MKLTETDTAFWNAVGEILHCEEDISLWTFDKEKEMLTLYGHGERTCIALSQLNQILLENADVLEKYWNGRIDSDWKIEISR